MSKKNIKIELLDDLDVDRIKATAAYKSKIVPGKQATRIQVVCNDPDLQVINELRNKLISMGIIFNNSQMIRLFIHNIDPNIDLAAKAKEIMNADRRKGVKNPDLLKAITEFEDMPLEPIYDKK